MEMEQRWPGHCTRVCPGPGMAGKGKESGFGLGGVSSTTEGKPRAGLGGTGGDLEIPGGKQGGIGPGMGRDRAETGEERGRE